MLIECLKEAVFLPEKLIEVAEMGTARGGVSSVVALFGEMVREFGSTTASMAQHKGILVLRQKKTHLVSCREGVCGCGCGCGWVWVWVWVHWWLSGIHSELPIMKGWGFKAQPVVILVLSFSLSSSSFANHLAPPHQLTQL